MAEVVFSNGEKASGGWSDEQKTTIIEELNRVLSHPVFSGSARCVALMRYVVHRALENGKSELKERTIGVEVFGRNTQYDVTTDPIVRRIANDIRKRLGQYYYQEKSTYQPVRFHLERGSYLPEFEFLPDLRDQRPSTNGGKYEIPTGGSNPSFVPEPEHNAPSAFSGQSSYFTKYWWIGLALLFVILPFSHFLIQKSNRRSPLERVWAPILDSKEVILVCLPIRGEIDQMGGTPTGRPTLNDMDSTSTRTQTDPPDSASTTIFRDVSAGTYVTTALSGLKQQANLRPSTAIKFRDLQLGPTVLIGGRNNPWVPRLLSNLRFTIQYDPETGDTWIQDSKNPAKRDWEVTGAHKDAAPADYAVITREFNQLTGQWVIALSGLTAKGTEVAAAVVTDPKDSGLIPAEVREDGNFQVIVRTSIISGEPGPVDVLAVQTW